MNISNNRNTYKQYKILPEIKRQVESIKKENSREQTLDVKKNAKSRKKSYGKKSALDKLRKIDGEEKNEE